MKIILIFIGLFLNLTLYSQDQKVKEDSIVNIIKTELQNKSVDNYLTYRVFDGNHYTYPGETEESELVDYYRIYFIWELNGKFYIKKVDNHNIFPEIEIDANKLFKRIIFSGTVPLKSIAEIPVGLQTSLDPVYIFKPLKESATHYYFAKDDIEYKVEKGICKPSIYDVSFKGFDTVSANSQMIFPYHIDGESASLISEIDFKTKFNLHETFSDRRKIESLYSILRLAIYPGSSICTGERTGRNRQGVT